MLYPCKYSGNGSSSDLVAGAVVGTLLGVVLLGVIVALAVVIILWRMGHLEELLAKIIQQRKTAGIALHHSIYCWLSLLIHF